MKTLSYVGGSVLLEDDTADAVLHYSLDLARRQAMDTVILPRPGHHENAQLQLIVGLGVPLAVNGVVDDAVRVDDADSLAAKAHGGSRMTAQHPPSADSEYIDFDLDWTDDLYGTG